MAKGKAKKSSWVMSMVKGPLRSHSASLGRKTPINKPESRSKVPISVPSTQKSNQNLYLFEFELINMSWKEVAEFKDLQTFNEPKRERTEKNNHSVLVNYVSFADPIT